MIHVSCAATFCVRSCVALNVSCVLCLVVWWLSHFPCVVTPSVTPDVCRVDPNCVIYLVADSLFHLVFWYLVHVCYVAMEGRVWCSGVSAPSGRRPALHPCHRPLCLRLHHTRLTPPTAAWIFCLKLDIVFTNRGCTSLSRSASLADHVWKKCLQLALRWFPSWR